jgi:hypothetical protein
VYHNLVLPPFPLFTAVAILGRMWSCRRIVQGLFASFQKARDAHTERTALCPAAVSERRIVRSWSGQMPIRICCVESSAVP